MMIKEKEETLEDLLLMKMIHLKVLKKVFMVYGVIIVGILLITMNFQMGY